jgi:hypothetical protein
MLRHLFTFWPKSAKPLNHRPQWRGRERGEWIGSGHRTRSKGSVAAPFTKALHVRLGAQYAAVTGWSPVE